MYTEGVGAVLEVRKYIHVEGMDAVGRLVCWISKVSGHVRRCMVNRIGDWYAFPVRFN